MHRMTFGRTDMIRWTKTGKTVKGNGETTITYSPVDPLIPLRIESRRRAIPHGPGSGKTGYWMNTTFFLINDGTGAQHEYYTLKDAKEAAEGMR